MGVPLQLSATQISAEPDEERRILTLTAESPTAESMTSGRTETEIRADFASPATKLAQNTTTALSSRTILVFIYSQVYAHLLNVLQHFWRYVVSLVCEYRY
jgi:hypothetical protein